MFALLANTRGVTIVTTTFLAGVAAAHPPTAQVSHVRPIPVNDVEIGHGSWPRLGSLNRARTVDRTGQPINVRPFESLIFLLGLDDGSFLPVGTTRFDPSMIRVLRSSAPANMMEHLDGLSLFLATREGLSQLVPRGGLARAGSGCTYFESDDESGTIRMTISIVPTWDETAGWRAYAGPVPRLEGASESNLGATSNRGKQPYPPLSGPALGGFDPSSGGSGDVVSMNAVQLPTVPELDALLQIEGGGLLAPFARDVWSVTALLLPSPPTPVAGQISLRTGIGHVLDASEIPPFPFIANPSLRVWEGEDDPSPPTTTDTFDLGSNPSMIPFVPVGGMPSYAGGMVYSVTLPSLVPAGTRFFLWNTFCANGKCFNTYFLDPITNLPTEEVEITTDMTGNFCALYICALISAAMEPQVAGFTCDVVMGTTIEIYVDAGNGIDEMYGGINIEIPVTPCASIDGTNHGFELGTLGGFTSDGNVQVVDDFFGIAPPEGSRMARLSTQPVGGQAAARLSLEDVALPVNVDRLQLTYNLLTHEAGENRIPNLSPVDVFWVEIDGVISHSFRAGDLSAVGAPGDCLWEFGPNGYCMSGFLTRWIDLSPYAGTTVDIVLWIGEPFGDDDIDSTLLVDAIAIGCD